MNDVKTYSRVFFFSRHLLNKNLTRVNLPCPGFPSSYADILLFCCLCLSFNDLFLFFLFQCLPSSFWLRAPWIQSNAIDWNVECSFINWREENNFIPKFLSSVGNNKLFFFCERLAISGIHAVAYVALKVYHKSNAPHSIWWNESS